MGKTVAISVGGSVILIAAANQAGIINVNWDKITKQVGETTSKLESKITQNAPTLRTSVSTISTFQHSIYSIIINQLLIFVIGRQICTNKYTICSRIRWRILAGLGFINIDI